MGTLIWLVFIIIIKTLTILCNRLKSSLQYVIIDDDIKEADTIEIAKAING